MHRIRWRHTHAERAVLRFLVEFDHHRIEMDGEPAVLITYRSTTSPDGSVMAVFHPAADRHPEAPPEVQQLVERLQWSEGR